MSRTLPTGMRVHAAGQHLISHAYDAASALILVQNIGIYYCAARHALTFQYIAHSHTFCAPVLSTRSPWGEFESYVERPQKPRKAMSKRRASTGMSNAARKNMTFLLVTLNYVLPHEASARMRRVSHFQLRLRIICRVRVRWMVFFMILDGECVGHREMHSWRSSWSSMVLILTLQTNFEHDSA